MDPMVLTEAFGRILDLADHGFDRHNHLVEAIPDVLGQPLKIVVPLPPVDVTNHTELDAYLERNIDFVTGISVASLFGCGR
jgi:hypothetical protein